jgi:3-oxoacyl-[acyl-carrier-protein] synthase II
MELAAFGRQKRISPSADPNCACRPFQQDSDGVTPAEGAAMMLLESQETASARGAKPYAELAGYGWGDGRRGCAGSMGSAVACAARETATTAGRAALILAHGDGAIDSDAREAAAIALLDPQAVTAIQASVGHTMATCGALNVAAACLVLATAQVPSIRTLQKPSVPLPFVDRPWQDARVSAVLVNAVDRAGAAASVLVARP